MPPAKHVCAVVPLEPASAPALGVTESVLPHTVFDGKQNPKVLAGVRVIPCPSKSAKQC
jgi:hypothetical protein